jgi:hypothetical protein
LAFPAAILILKSIYADSDAGKLNIKIFMVFPDKDNQMIKNLAMSFPADQALYEQMLKEGSEMDVKKLLDMLGKPEYDAKVSAWYNENVQKEVQKISEKK